MKTRTLVTITGIATLLAACIPSVQPFYTDKDLVFESRLLGEWTKGKDDEAEVWKFEQAGDRAYTLTLTDKEGKKGEFAAHLFKLKNEHFLDIIPTDCEYANDQAEMVAASMFPGHLLLRVPQLTPELKLAFCDFDWLAKHLADNPKALAHHREDKRIVLTASTKELQKFVLAHLREEEFFGTPDTFLRKSNAAPAAGRQ